MEIATSIFIVLATVLVYATAVYFAAKWRNKRMNRNPQRGFEVVQATEGRARR